MTKGLSLEELNLHTNLIACQQLECGGGDDNRASVAMDNVREFGAESAPTMARAAVPALRCDIY